MTEPRKDPEDWPVEPVNEQPVPEEEIEEETVEDPEVRDTGDRRNA